MRRWHGLVVLFVASSLWCIDATLAAIIQRFPFVTCRSSSLLRQTIKQQRNPDDWRIASEEDDATSAAAGTATMQRSPAPNSSMFHSSLLGLFLRQNNNNNNNDRNNNDRNNSSSRRSENLSPSEQTLQTERSVGSLLGQRSGVWKLATAPPLVATTAHLNNTTRSTKTSASSAAAVAATVTRTTAALDPSQILKPPKLWPEPTSTTTTGTSRPNHRRAKNSRRTLQSAASPTATASIRWQQAFLSPIHWIREAHTSMWMQVANATAGLLFDSATAVAVAPTTTTSDASVHLKLNNNNNLKRKKRRLQKNNNNNNRNKKKKEQQQPNNPQHRHNNPNITMVRVHSFVHPRTGHTWKAVNTARRKFLAFLYYNNITTTSTSIQTTEHAFYTARPDQQDEESSSQEDGTTVDQTHNNQDTTDQTHNPDSRKQHLQKQELKRQQQQQQQREEERLRDEWRCLWKQGRLLTDRTEFLAVYPSDSSSTLATTGGGRRHRRNNAQNQQKQQTMPNNKRGGFADLLHLYRERLVAILEDEQQDLAEATRRSRQQQQHQPSFPLYRGSSSASSSSSSSSSASQSSSSLLVWLQEHYGKDATEQLQAENLQRLPPTQQLAQFKHFLEWFRGYFPYFYDRCGACGASIKEEQQNAQVNGNSNNNDAGPMCTNNDDSDIFVDDFEDDEDRASVYQTFMGYVYPNDDELTGKAARTELYHCHKCGSFTRFPRYNSAWHVMNHRRGRCGEYSMLLYRFLRALNHEARWVVDWADHVWAEVYLEGAGKNNMNDNDDGDVNGVVNGRVDGVNRAVNGVRNGVNGVNGVNGAINGVNGRVNGNSSSTMGKNNYVQQYMLLGGGRPKTATTQQQTQPQHDERHWIHLDPCEAAVNENLIYEGWGKKQTYIVGFYAPRFNPTTTAWKPPQPWDTRRTMQTVTSLKTPLIQDLTLQYTSDKMDMVSRRREESTTAVEAAIVNATNELSARLVERRIMDIRPQQAPSLSSLLEQSRFPF